MQNHSVEEALYLYMLSFSHLFKQFLQLNPLIYKSRLRLCNYKRSLHNFLILQKLKNFRHLTKIPTTWYLWQHLQQSRTIGKVPLESKTGSRIRDWFFSNDGLSKGSEGWKNLFIHIHRRTRNLSLHQTKKKLLCHKPLFKNIWFQYFEKSNQNTSFWQRPISYPLQWIQKGDVLSDCSASKHGELALGQNLLVAYMPWEGLNFEDAVLINKKILSKYTSLHIQKYELEIFEESFERITCEIPGIPKKDTQKLDQNGIIKIGSWVQENDILVGKILSNPSRFIPPLLTHEKLLYDLIGYETVSVSHQEKCLRVPLGSFGRIIRIIYTHEDQQSVNLSDSPSKGTTAKDGKGISNERITQKSFLTWYPLFFKSCSVVFNSLYLQQMKFRMVFSRWFWFYKFYSRVFNKKKFRQLFNSVNGKKKFVNHSCRRGYLWHMVPKVPAPEGGTSGIWGQVPPANHQNDYLANFLTHLNKVTIYIAEQRKFQIGDKISGRHGNKGIISQICSNEDMPYCLNGSTLDILLNPLGVPSRMNVGQIFECLLGFTGQIFQTKFQVVCFDEIYGYEASRSFIYSKLLESCKKTGYPWLFSKKTPGKSHLFDGRDGCLFHQSVTIGSSYLMKLIHIVDEKIHARATGPYSLITQQPLRGRAQHGGQRVGEMEVWALQGFGSAYTLQELLTVKSDDLQGRYQLMHTLLKNTPLRFGTPESFRVVVRELQCLCLDLQLT